jgi:hypothetical protein
MRSWLMGGGVVLALVGLAVTGVIFTLSPRAPIEPVRADFDDLEPDMKAVSVRGTAHYRGVLVQHPRGGCQGSEPMYVYALFPVGDVLGREVRVLVRTRERPSPRVDFEFVEVEGFFDPPRPHTVPFDTEEKLARADYFFHPDLRVIEAWSVRTVSP